MKDKKMMLGGAGPSELGKAKEKLSINRDVQVVGPEQAQMSQKKPEAIRDCCSASPLKMKGM